MAACGTCGFANEDAARFCGSCGASLTANCPRCDAPLNPGLRFCTNCGEPVAGASAPPIEVEVESGPAERRRVSVLFVDLENFTTLAESLDPEEVRSVQSRYFEVARSIVATYGGTVEKFIGDAVMAVWGAPAAHEDDAERAVHAALGIVDAVGRLGGAAGGRLSARAAITSGEAAVTVGALDQGMVAGDLVNVAARLQSRAPTGGVLVDDATRELAPQAAGYERAGRLNLKGRSARLRAHRAIRLGSSPRPGRERGSHTGPYVGRDRELQELVDLFESVTRDGLSRLVSVTGIAGIGKSRLAWELSERLEARPELIAWHAGRAPAYGEGITFAAVTEMIRRRIRVAEDADPELVRRQLAATLDELVRDEGERRWMEPRLGVLLNREGEQAFERDELFAAWRRFFERVADRAPTVLIFEDLHWADPALLDFVEHIATWSREHPILIVTLARPELLDRRPSWAGGAARATALHLDPLPDDAMRELLLGRSPDLDERLVDGILQRAGGVPLYAVEVVRILADRDARGLDRRATERGGSERRIGSIGVPDSLHGVIAARIDALPATDRRTLLSAAVLGRRFRAEALAATAGIEVGALREQLDGLVRRELLAVDEDLGSPGHGQLTFVQDLVREVAYGTLARSERRTLHLAAARYLESRDDGDTWESLASHLVEAHRLAPEHPDAPRIARRAVGALRQAARDAMRVHVPDRALGYLERAMRLIDTDGQRAIVLEETASAARAASRLEVAERHLRELVQLHVDAGNDTDATRARARLASVLLMAQRNDTALAELEAAVAAMGDIGRDSASVEVAAQLARARLLVGEARAGLEWAERALEAATRLGLEPIATDVLITLGTARFRLGEEEAGLADLRRAVAEAETGGFLTAELRARNNIAWLVVADDPRVTFETARQGFELASTMGIGDIAVQLAEVACAAAIETGDWDWARSTTAAILGGPLPEANRINAISNAAIIGALAGQPERIAELEGVLPLPADTDGQVVGGVLHARAWIALTEARFQEAERLATEAASRVFGAERSQLLALKTRAALWRGDGAATRAALDELRALNVSGRAAEAAVATLAAGMDALESSDPRHAVRTAYKRVCEAWRGLDLPLHLALCLMDRDRLLGDDGGLGDEADVVLRELQADGLLRLAGGRLPEGSHS